MSNKTILASVKLSAESCQTGKTKHYRGDSQLPAASELNIVQYSDDPGHYLLYLDAQGNELTDTYHDGMTAAMEQAQWEYSVQPNDWVLATG